MVANNDCMGRGMSCRCNRDNWPIPTWSGFLTHTTSQSTTNFAMKTTSQHSHVIYQTKAKGMLYTYWHSFIVLVLVYSDITCIVVREAALKIRGQKRPPRTQKTHGWMGGRALLRTRPKRTTWLPAKMDQPAQRERPGFPPKWTNPPTWERFACTLQPPLSAWNKAHSSFINDTDLPTASGGIAMLHAIP
jgi:hypothetical protein